MKKKTAVVLVLAIACFALTLSVIASSAKNVPTLFHNDEAWYKDEMAPAVFEDGKFYVPSDFLAMFDYISFTTVRDGENLLLTNSETGGYISILHSLRAACANGEIMEDIRIFRENGYYYLDVELVAEHLGLYVEYSREADASERSVRVYDNTRIMGFEELLAAYDGGEAEETGTIGEDDPDGLFPAETEPGETVPGEKPTRIFLVCTDSREGDRVSAVETVQRLGFTCSLFLDGESEWLREVDMNKGLGLSVTSLEEAEELNGTLDSLFCRKSHIVLSTGNDGEDQRLSRAGYFILKPDFIVNNTTDASVVLRKIEEYTETREYITVLLGNVWQTETLLMEFAKLDGNEYKIGEIPGFH